jgi:CO/xanthine dehydrogenase FAD-binding subunit
MYNPRGCKMSNETRLFRPINYMKPSSVVEATKLLGEYAEKARLIAGGTDILVERDPGIQVLIDATGLGLEYIKSDDKEITIGAATTFNEIEKSPILAKSPYGILAEAAKQIGTPQIRNVATIGGNICSAVPSADSVPPLLALDATVLISGSEYRRSMNIADFFLNVRRNALKKGEMLIEIRIPVFSSRTEAVFVKRGRVAGADLAIVNAAVRITVGSDGIIQDARIALGAVAPTPMRAEIAESMLRGLKPQGELLKIVADQASQEIKPISDVRGSAEYRKLLSRVLVERALNELTSKFYGP